MNIADTLWGLIRRWYIVLPGIILALTAGLGLFTVVQPGYERTSTQLLLPGEGTIPTGVTNPYLFLGGLTQASDVVVRVMQSNEVIGKVVEKYPGTEIVVERDPTVSGPVIRIVVTAKSDEVAGEALTMLADETSTVLDQLQTEQNVATKDRMSVSTITFDEVGVPQQKTRLVLSAGAAFGLIVVTLLVASFVDGVARGPHRRGRAGGHRRGDADPAKDDDSPSSSDDAMDADLADLEAAQASLDEPSEIQDRVR